MSSRVSQFACALSYYACSCVCVCVCICVCACACARAFTRLGTGRLLTHFELFSFFIHSPRAATRLLLSLSFLFSSSSRSPPSIYLVIIVTWITSDREELSFENKSPAYKRQWKRNFIWIPTAQAADEFAAALCASVFTFWVILFFAVVVGNSRVWGGQGTWDDVCGEKIQEHFHLFLLRMKICGTKVERTTQHCDLSCEHSTSWRGLMNAQKMWVY